MKRNFTFIFSLLYTLYSFAQVPNAGFENWTTVSNDWHLSYYRQDGDCLSNGVVKHQPAYQGSYAVKLTTLASDDKSMITSGIVAEPLKGGFPYSQQPTKLRLYAKYNILPGDAASVLIAFKKNGTVISGSLSNNLFAITGSHTNDYQLLEFPITGLTSTPDSVIIVISSADLRNDLGLTGGNQQAGTYLIVDNLSFDTSAPIPHGDFEEWGRPALQPDNYMMERANATLADYNIVNPLQKTTDAHSGSFALKASTWFDPDSEKPRSNGYTGIAPIDKQIKFSSSFKCGVFTGWYKYSPASTDTANICIKFYRKNGSQIGQVQTELYATSTYTQYSLPFLFAEVSDSVSIEFQTSVRALQKNIGSTLYLDDLAIESPITVSPSNPTPNDVITIITRYSSGQSLLCWGVNGWQISNPVYRPASTVNNNYVPFTLVNGKWQVQIGPFNNPVQVVSDIEFAIKHSNENWGWDNNNGKDYKYTISPPAAIENTLAGSSLLLYPQPLTDKLNISIPQGSENYVWEVVITDFAGRKVRTEQVEGNSAILERKDLKAGIYILKLINEEHHLVYKQKLVVK